MCNKLCIPPSLTEDEKEVFSLDKLRRIYGENGSASGINVSLLWPSKEELEFRKEEESVTYPNKISHMIEIARKTQGEEERKINQRQEELARKVAKLEEWKNEVRGRVAQQAKQAREAKEKKEKLLEEVRQMFGFRIDPKDERFKEALAKKELEEKRAAKAAKKLKRQQKLIADIQRLADGNIANTGDKAAKESQGAETPSPIIVDSPTEVKS